MATCERCKTTYSIFDKDAKDMFCSKCAGLTSGRVAEEQVGEGKKIIEKDKCDKATKIGPFIFIMTGIAVMLGLFFIPGEAMYWEIWTPGSTSDLSPVQSPVLAAIVGAFTGVLCWLAFEGTIPIPATLSVFVLSIVLAFKTEGVGYCEAVPVTLI